MYFNYEFEEIEYCVVLVTVPSEEAGETISDVLLTEQLASCISTFPIKSAYVWNGKITKDQEFQLFIKTRKDLFPQVQEKVRNNHSFEVPEIIMLDIHAGFDKYLNWISETTQKH